MSKEVHESDWEQHKPILFISQLHMLELDSNAGEATHVTHSKPISQSGR